MVFSSPCVYDFIAGGKSLLLFNGGEIIAVARVTAEFSGKEGGGQGSVEYALNAPDL